jgi:hypothetical protein
MWVAIHMCMEAMLGMSLYSYLYLKVAKTLCLSYYLVCFLFNKIGQQEGGGLGIRGKKTQMLRLNNNDIIYIYI